MKVIINLVLARDYALGQIQHIPEMAFIWSLICMDLHMPNKIGMSKSEYDSSFKWCHIRSSYDSDLTIWGHILYLWE